MAYPLLMFKLNQIYFGLETQFIIEIVRLQEARIFKMPKMKADIKGLLALRGSVYPVLDKRLKEGLNLKEARILIINYNHVTIGLIVDEVVSYLSDDQFKTYLKLESEGEVYQIMALEMLF